MREIIIDVETAPLPKEELEEYGKKFPKKPNAKKYKLDKPGLYWNTGQITCVGMQWGDDDFEVICTGDESDTLREAHEILKDYKDIYVSYNGANFDFPYLAARSFKNLIPMKLPLGKYSKTHIDIFQLLGSTYGANICSLEEVAHHFGVHDSLWGKGSQVEEWWDKKDYKSIKRHNQGDINTTYKIYHGFIKLAF